MTRIGRRLIEDFLLPALNDERYGDLLKWIDRDHGYFSIRWSHKNAAKWTLADTAVFQDWDRLKGHYHPEIKGYYMQAKQRFRAALYKLNTVIKLPCEDKHVKKYQLVLDHDKRKVDFLGRSKIRPPRKDESQKSIPTPVICKNTSYQPKIEESCSPPSPASSTKSESSDKIEEYKLEEYEKCLKEYQLAQQKQMMLSHRKQLRQIIPKTETSLKERFEASLRQRFPSPLMRQSPKLNFVRRIPHVPIQPVPVYTSKCPLRNTVDCAQRRYESPHVLLVQTYNDTNGENPQIKVEVPEEMVECIIGNEQNFEGALNLSTKCEDSEILSR